MDVVVHYEDEYFFDSFYKAVSPGTLLAFCVFLSAVACLLQAPKALKSQQVEESTWDEARRKGACVEPFFIASALTDPVGACVYFDCLSRWYMARSARPYPTIRVHLSHR